jgi:hypothetical protein
LGRRKPWCRIESSCRVAVCSHNPPKIYQALQAGKLGQITVVAFDEDPVTRGAVKEGAGALSPAHPCLMARDQALSDPVRRAGHGVFPFSII